MANLTNKNCSSAPLKLDNTESDLLLSELSDWLYNDNKTIIEREFKFKNYFETTSFINAVAWIVHNQDHHPDINFSYNKCTIRFNTHSVKGLSENDFICAAKIDLLI